jgi:predicted metalloprotease
VLALLFGVDPSMLLQDGGPAPAPQTRQMAPAAPSGAPAARDPMRDFVAVVLADTEDVWRDQFQKIGRQYREPKLVLFRNAIQSECGFAQAAVGPFYCPADQKVYIDLAFYQELRDRFRAPGDFAQAYVVAHEIGHHVQRLLGLTERVAVARQNMSQRDYNALSVRVELQADCYAGVWAFHAQRMRNILEPGDLEEALNAAAAIGDDRLQKQAQGRVVPDSFTHGSSAQRVRWFKRGFDSGDMQQCDTINASQL